MAEDTNSLVGNEKIKVAENTTNEKDDKENKILDDTHYTDEFKDAESSASPSKFSSSSLPSQISMNPSQMIKLSTNFIQGKLEKLRNSESFERVHLRLKNATNLSETQEMKAEKFTLSELRSLQKALSEDTLDALLKEDSKLGEIFRKILEFKETENTSLKATSGTPSKTSEVKQILKDESNKSQLSIVLEKKIFQIPFKELLDLYSLIPEDIAALKRHSNRIEDVLTILDSKSEHEILKGSLDISDHQLQALIQGISLHTFEHLTKDNTALGKALREILEISLETTEPQKLSVSENISTDQADEHILEESQQFSISKRTSINEANKSTLEMKNKIEEQSKKINFLKAHLHFYNSKQQKKSENKKKVHDLKKAIDYENKCLENLIQSFFQLQKESNGRAFEPILLASTLKEDLTPKCITLAPKSSAQMHFLTPSIQKCLKIGSNIIPSNGNISLEKECRQMKKEVMKRDYLVEKLHTNLKASQQKLAKVTQEKIQLTCKLESKDMTDTVRADIECPLHGYTKNADLLNLNIARMRLALKKLQIELSRVEKQRDELKVESTARRLSTENNLEQQNADLKKQYTLLIQKHNRKEREINELNDQLLKGIKTESFNVPVQKELKIMKKQYNEVLNEPYEFNIIIEEQARQVEEYREKFMCAQQTVEEQRRQIQMMEINNQNLEAQINLEIQRVKEKFKEKMRKLASLPKILENEQLKVYETNKEKSKLEGKLKEIQNRLVFARKQIEDFKSKYNETDSEVIIDNLRNQKIVLTDKIDSLKHERNLLQEMLADEKYRYETLRSQAVKIMERTKERSEDERYMQYKQISELENELAKIRADAAHDIAMKQEAIKNIRAQIKMLSGNFGNAQIQIKSLKNQINFLTRPKTVTV